MSRYPSKGTASDHVRRPPMPSQETITRGSPPSSYTVPMKVIEPCAPTATRVSGSLAAVIASSLISTFFRAQRAWFVITNVLCPLRRTVQGGPPVRQSDTIETTRPAMATTQSVASLQPAHAAPTTTAMVRNVPLLDRVFPADQCDPTHGDRWLATLHPNLRRTA